MFILQLNGDSVSYDEMMTTVYLSLFFVGLSLAMALLVTKINRTVMFVSIVYFITVALTTWLVEFKWLLGGSLGYMVMAMSYSAWVVYIQSKRCRDDLKGLHDKEHLYEK